MALKVLDAKKILLSDEDIRRVAEIEVHPEIRKWDIDYVHRSNDLETGIRGFKGFFDRVHKGKNQLCLIAKLDDKVVGFLGIHRFGEPHSHTGDVGVMVHPEYQRRCIGTILLKAGIELAKEKGFKRLEADTLASNKAMRGTAEKAGFQLEGTKRKAINMHRLLEDEALYAILL